MATKKPLKVKKWIVSGELSGTNRTMDAVIAECGIRLDKSCTSEILGEVLFLATDGKYYTITVEAVIGRANPEWVKEVIKA